MALSTNSEYKNWLIELKANIKRSQIKAALAVNSELIHLYWDLGKQIVEKQKHAQWGSGFIDQLSKDLKAEFPEMGGFSRANLFAVKNFYLFYSQTLKVEQDTLLLKNTIVQQVVGQLDKAEQTISQLENPIQQQLVSKLENADNQATTKSQQPVAQLENQLFNIPWGHHVMIIQKVKNVPEAIFYVQQTIENNWSRAVLEMQIETNLYARQGKAITNFKTTLPEIDSDLAQALLKDTYNFEFISFSGKVKELELEQKLIDNITKFLLELGKGFAYMGRQFEINVGGEIFKTDLLFYHTKLKCYIVIELKVTKFKPEYVGKLNFYLTAIDRLVKDSSDKPSIGILLCKTKNDVVVDFALHDTNKPMGISEYTYTQLPTLIQQALPTIQQFTEQLNQDDEA